MLTIEHAQLLTTDKAIGLREVGYRELIKLGEKPDPRAVRKALTPGSSKKNPQARALAGLFAPREERADTDDVLIEIYGTYSREDLELAVEWFSMNGSLAYTALGLNHFADVAERVRRDIAQNFDAVRTASMEKLRRLYGDRADTEIADWQRFDSSIRSDYLKAAVRILATHGDVTDLPFVREYVGAIADREAQRDRKTTEALMQFLQRFGSATDAALLLRLAEHSSWWWGDDRMAPALLDCALALSPGKDGIAPTLLASTQRGFVRAAARALRGTPLADRTTLAYPLLNADDSDIRLDALALLTTDISEPDLERTLDQYVEEGTYYYDAVVWMERCLFAPEPLRGVYRAKLADRIA